MLPAVYFIFSRKGCDEAVRQCVNAGLRLTTPEDRKLIRATVAWAQGHPASAVDHLRRAEAALRRCDMNQYAAAACYRRGQIEGGSTGAQLMREGAEWMQAERVVNPHRVLDLLAPGPWPKGVALHG